MPAPFPGGEPAGTQPAEDRTPPGQVPRGASWCLGLPFGPSPKHNAETRPQSTLFLALGTYLSWSVSLLHPFPVVSSLPAPSTLQVGTVRTTILIRREALLVSPSPGKSRSQSPRPTLRGLRTGFAALTSLALARTFGGQQKSQTRGVQSVGRDLGELLVAIPLPYHEHPISAQVWTRQSMDLASSPVPRCLVGRLSFADSQYCPTR